MNDLRHWITCLIQTILDFLQKGKRQKISEDKTSHNRHNEYKNGCSVSYSYFIRTYVLYIINKNNCVPLIGYM